MRDLFLSPPWWLSAIVLIAGVVLFSMGNSRRQTKVRLAGILVVLLAVLMMVLGHFIETDQEKVTRLTRELVQSVPGKDWPKMLGLLDKDATLGPYIGSEKLVDGARSNVETWGVKSVAITSLKAVPDQPGQFTVDIDTLADADKGMGNKVPSSWRFHWDKTGDDWHVHQIECTRIAGESASSINQLIGK